MKIEHRKHQILIVDDVPENLKLLSDLLTSEGYMVRVASSGKLAIRSVEAEQPDLILMDVRMPTMDGFEVCRRIKAVDKNKSIPVIFISANDDVDSKMKGFTEGGVDYITKPLQELEVLARVKTHLSLHQMAGELELHNNHLEELVKDKTREIAELQYTTIHAMTKLAEYRDDNTGQHIERTRLLCRMLAIALRSMSYYTNEIDRDFIGNLYQAAPLHDIGKVGIPDSILLKPGKLTDEEFEVIKTHTTIGAEALKHIQEEYPQNRFVNMGIELTQSHHEKWNGKGYPDGLKGDSIPLSARIMAVVDVYDALRSERPYKKAMSHEKSLAIILEESGQHFDPKIVEAFKAIEEKVKGVGDES